MDHVFDHIQLNIHNIYIVILYIYICVERERENRLYTVYLYDTCIYVYI